MACTSTLGLSLDVIAYMINLEYLEESEIQRAFYLTTECSGRKFLLYSHRTLVGYCRVH